MLRRKTDQPVPPDSSEGEDWGGPEHRQIWEPGDWDEHDTPNPPYDPPHGTTWAHWHGA
ncbi:hypothetical protein [Streptomyces sp. NPDC093060]|uniref:hypothetical protein n=1 Tax=Streptomyces sp. NPDC093060 TaxID=3366019 RepID=UPI00382520ED